jgi:CRP/FNR family transcriptional regulator/CRP/FNR family cyclic AMP-dependent transcriptional regulator
MGELAKRLRKSDQQIEALSLSDAEHRIGVSILNLAEDMGVIRKGQVTIEKLPFQQDIANMSGTSRETVSRVLKLFEDRNMITKIGHTVVIPDYAFFKRLFDKTV